MGGVDDYHEGDVKYEGRVGAGFLGLGEHGCCLTQNGELRLFGESQGCESGPAVFAMGATD